MHRNTAAQDGEEEWWVVIKDRRLAATLWGEWRLATAGPALTSQASERHLQVFQPAEAAINAPLVHGDQRGCGEPLGSIVLQLEHLCLRGGAASEVRLWPGLSIRCPRRSRLGSRLHAAHTGPPSHGQGCPGSLLPAPLLAHRNWSSTM